ncbi:glycosyltransferase family 2 protein [Labrenzia sp. CE80]|uniref:glycosyltransferase family 2 protein n=1 Tax=Labrenzia sp. CE80 TaxID=1788986 RepID=UPI00129A5125|nr:glycosyltransferase family 2 protein [Labrenzia sp. CE80]
MQILKDIGSAAERYKNGLTARGQLQSVYNRTKAIRDSDVLLVCCLRNERHRVSYFYEYYRSLGVDHFLFVDNGSSDGFQEWAHQHADVSVWKTEASYKNSNFGVEWCNYLLSRYGTGHLCLTVDPDEFLVYPHCETRSLAALGEHLKDSRKQSLSVLMLDMYSEGALEGANLEDGMNPFEVCRYFDRDGYVQRKNHLQGVFVQGGPRMRIHNREKPEISPALNKVPLVWWQRHFRYVSSTHNMEPLLLNRPNAKGSISLTGCLLHFKFVAALREKILEEKSRKQHYQAGREYEKYDENKGLTFFDLGISVEYQSPQQLVSLGLMTHGEWF